MKNIILILMTISLVLLAGCAKDNHGKLHIYNRTAYNVYASIQGQSYTIPGGMDKSIKVRTSDKSIVEPSTDPGKRKMELVLFGETFQIEDEDENGHIIFVNSTIVDLDDEETLPIYCDPNRASVKITNNSNTTVTMVTVHKYFILTAQELPYTAITDSIPHGVSTFKQLDPNLQGGTPFYYKFFVTMADGRILPYGGELSTRLVEDEQYPIVIPAEDKRRK